MKIMKFAAAATAVMALAAASAHAGTVGDSTITGSHIIPNLGSTLNGAVYGYVGAVPNNVGTAASSVSPSWVLKGAVSTDCVFFLGTGVSNTLDFGTIGIQTQASSGPGNVFNMAGPLALAITTTVAGCNTKNDVTISKAHAAGMVNSTSASYDTNQFTNAIDYSATAAWTGIPAASPAGPGSAQSITANLGQQTDTNHQGAWRSGMVVTVGAPVPSKALLAGTYQDTLTVSITAVP